MSCLCTSNSIFYMGCFCYCEDIYTGIPANEDGIFKIEIEYLGAVIYQELDLKANDEIILSFDKNENYLYNVKITHPDETFQCYQFKTQFCV